jgi:DHA1 family inner membrane transport protein
MSDLRAIAGGLVMGCAVGANVANIGAVASDMGAAYGVSLTVVGLFTTALFVTHTAVMIPGGQAIDRFGARRLGFAALLVILAGNAIAMIAKDPALLIPARAFTGIGTGVGFIAASDYVRSAGGSAFAQGLFGGVATAGGALSLAAVPPLERWIGWRAPFALMIALALVALVALALSPLRQAIRPAGEGRRATALQVLGDRRLYGFAVMQAAAFGLSVVVGNWVGTLLEHHGYSTWLASALGAVTLGLSVFSRPLGGWIERTHPEYARASVAASLAVGAAACAGLAASGPLVLALISVVALGIAAGIPFAAGFAGAARVRPDAPGAAIGLVNMAGGVTILVVTPLVGQTFDLPGDGRIGFLAMGVLWGSSLLWLPSFERARAEPAGRVARGRSAPVE